MTNPPKWSFPKEEEVPKEFWDHYHPYYKVISLIFFNGVKDERVEEFIMKPTIPKEWVVPYWSFIHHHLGSFSYEHNYKIAGCAYLLSQGFQILDYPGKEEYEAAQERRKRYASETSEERKARFLKEIQEAREKGEL